jgi:3'-phosphoadenosine 5'-phosphosulfate sulfotransferase (PAPS reductase)/FAD synthetase
VSRTVVWFSAGAASAVAAKLTLASVPKSEVFIVYTNPGSEHPDNERFLKDAAEWFGHPIEQLRSEKYADTWDVFNKTNFLVSAFGARCTVELKKRLRFKYQLPDDRQVFGYTSEEQHRANRFKEQNPGVELITPLIDKGLTKSDCLAIIERAGIKLPAMYELGYRNNNCIGCVKGGAGYWNKIRRDFPETFQRMSELERKIGNTILKDNDGRIFLDELNPNKGNHADEPDFECSLLCALAEDEIK